MNINYVLLVILGVAIGLLAGWALNCVNRAFHDKDRDWK